MMACCLWFTVCLAGCEPEQHDDILTTARVTLATPDSIALLQAMGTVTVECLTNRMAWTGDEWDSISIVFPEVMRGPYNISADGKVAVKINNGKRKVYRFRAANSYVEFLDQPTDVKLDIELIK
jgi:hypothetical protein